MSQLLETITGSRVVVAVSVTSGSPIAVEIAGDMGFSAVVIDARHGPVSPYSHELGSLVRAAPVVRGAGYGGRTWDEYYKDASDALVFIMVEDTDGVSNIEEIVKVPGVDGIMVGTWDLAVELGRASYGPTHPDVMKHVDHVIDVTTEAGLFMCAHAWSGEAAGAYINRGCQLMFVSLDSNLLIAGLKSVRETAVAVESLEL